MNKQFFIAGTALTIALALGITNPHRADAQLDPSVRSFVVREYGRPQAEIFRIDLDSEHYVEHWVLYPGYVYPSEKNGISLEITPGYRSYKNADDFFRSVPWSEGSRYVKTECFDGAELPVAR